MAKQKEDQTFNDEVVAGGNGNRNNDPKGITGMEHWEKDFDNMPFWDKIEKLLELPSTKDMAGIIIRSIVKDDRQANAILRLSYRHKKFHDNTHQEMLREKLAMNVAMGGVGRIEAVFGGVNMIAPDMYRVARGMPKNDKPKENIQKNSDFRERRDEPRPEDR